MLSSSLIGCAPSYTEEDLEAAREAGFSEGYATGKAEGHEAGLAQSETETVSVQSTTPDESTSSPTTESVSTPTPTPPEPARFVLGELTITPTEANLGETVTISIPVSNTGGTEGSYTIVFTVKKAGCWSDITDVEVKLKPGETKTVTSTTKGLASISDISKTVPGIYTVHVGDKVGQFTMIEPPPTPEELEAQQIIEDLAYIKASTMVYSDDADPEYEGISISVRYYDSKSKLITPNGISVQVTVELYWYTNYPSIYQNQFTVEYPEYSGPLVRPSNEEIVRIPYDSIEGKPSGMTRGPILILTVNTPVQGNFEAQETIPGLIWP